MSLAGKLLYGTSVTESVDFDINEMASGYNAIATESWIDTALESLVTDIYNVDKAYHTADIIAEVKVIREGADPSVLLEGIVSGGIEKIKNAFKKFWAKLKNWFAAVKRQFNLIFKTGKDFIKEFKSELNKKSEKGFTYTGRDYDIEGGNSASEAIFDATQKKIEIILGYVRVDGAAMSDAGSKDDYIKLLANSGIRVHGSVDVSSSDVQDEFIKTLTNVGINKASDISELRENLVEKYHNGNDSENTDTFDDFEGKCGKSYMITFVESAEKKISDIEKKEKKFDTLMNKVIKAFDGISKKDVGEDEAQYKRAQYVSRAVNGLLPVGKLACSVQQEMYKEASGQFERVLKSFLRWKPAKESYEYESGTDSLLEQAMGMISF